MEKIAFSLADCSGIIQYFVMKASDLQQPNTCQVNFLMCLSPSSPEPQVSLSSLIRAGSLRTIPSTNWDKQTFKSYWTSPGGEELEAIIHLGLVCRPA